MVKDDTKLIQDQTVSSLGLPSTSDHVLLSMLVDIGDDDRGPTFATSSKVIAASFTSPLNGVKQAMVAAAIIVIKPFNSSCLAGFYSY